MIQLLIFGSVFVCGASLVAGIAFVLRNSDGDAENRLTDFVQNRAREKGKSVTQVLTNPLDNAPGQIEAFVSNYFNLNRYISQAGLKITVTQFVAMVAGLGIGGFLVSMVLLPIKIFAPMIGLALAFLPLIYLIWCRKKRLQKFGGQLPECLELISRALRAGHSLPAGIQLVAQQMSEPLGPEFARSYEEQNLGVSLEDSLKNMTERVPNLDLKFFRNGRPAATTDGGRFGRDPGQNRAADPRTFPDLGSDPGVDGRRPPVGDRAAGVATGAVPGDAQVEL